jgi:O-antigen ligase
MNFLANLIARRRAILNGIIWLAACGLAGTIAVPFAGLAADKPSRIILLPAAIALLFFLVLDKARLLMLIVLVRASCDLLLEETKLGPFLSIGAMLNALVIGIAALFVFERPRPFMRTVLPMWGPLLVMVLFAMLRAPEGPSGGLRLALAYISYMAMFTVPFYLKACQKDLRACVYIVLLSSIVPALYGFADFALGLCNRPDARICGTFQHPNVFAFYLVFLISVAFYAIKSQALKFALPSRLMLIAYVLIILTLLVLTKTRSAWAACLFTFLIYGAFFQRRYLVYLVVGCCIASLIPQIQDRILDALQGQPNMWGQPENSYEWRRKLWEDALRWMEPHKMVLGYGLRSFYYHSVKFFSLSGGFNAHAHSVYMEWFFEAGAIGLLAAAWLFYRLIMLLKAGFARDKLGVGIVLTIMFEYLVVSYSDNMLSYLSFNWYFWFLMGAACSAFSSQGAEEPRRAEESEIMARPAGRLTRSPVLPTKG